MKRISGLVALAVGVLVGLHPTPALASTQCKSLTATRATRHQLSATHFQLQEKYSSQLFETGAVGKIYLGECGGTQWAATSFLTAQLGTQDQPELFEKQTGGSWRDLGDTAGSPGTISAFPKELLGVWHYRAAWSNSSRGFFVATMPSQIAARPSFLLLSADNTFYVSSLSWKSWGSAHGAVADGKVWTTSCKPDCAASKRVSHPGIVELSAAVRCDGTAYYTHAAILWSDDGKKKRASEQLQNPCKSPA
jgi:hypothetical protein